MWAYCAEHKSKCPRPTLCALLCKFQSLLLNTITCKDGNSVSRERLSLMKTVATPIAAPCQVPSMGLLLSHLRNQDLTLIEHLLVPGRAPGVMCYLVDFPPPHSAGTTALPLTREKWGAGREGNLLKAEAIASATFCTEVSVSGGLRGADPASCCHLNVPDSVQVASCGRR